MTDSYERIERITQEMVTRLTDSDVLDDVNAESVVYYMEPLARLHMEMVNKVPGISDEELVKYGTGYGQHLAIFARVCFELGREQQRIQHLFDE